MTKETLIVLCASLCFALVSATSLEARSQGVARQAERRTANQGKALADSSTTRLGDKILLADRVEVKKNLKEIKEQKDEEIRLALEKEGLENPAGDLYGDDSWGGTVNPFASQGINIPDRYDIDINNFVIPIDRKQITSHYGYRSRFGRMHYGIDLALKTGDEVRSAFAGKVRVVGYDPRGYGHYVVVRHDNGLETVYGHLSRAKTREGAKVKAGELIGLGGSTGRSTGPHLHFEARFMGIPLNPAELFDFEIGVPQMDVYTFVRRDHGAPRRNLASTSKARRSTTKASVPKTHRVASGETLSSIARKYGTTISKLQKANGLKSTKLSAGKSLRIPS